MRSRSFNVWLVVFAFAIAGCSRCGKTATRAPVGLAAHVPANAQGVLFVPDLGRLGDKLSQLQKMTLANFAAQLQGFPSASAFVDALVNQAGVDPRSRDSMKKAGIAPERGLAVVQLAPNRSAVLVGVSDPKKFEAWLSTQARNRLGAGQVAHRDVDGVRETVFSGANGTALLAVVELDGEALVAAGPAIELLPRLDKLPVSESLDHDAAFTAAIAPLPNDRDVFGYAPAGSPLLDPKVADSGAALSLDLTSDALTARIFLPRPDAPKEVQAFQKVDAPDWTWMLDPTSVLRVRAAVAPSKFAGIWQRYTPNRINFALSAAGLDVDHQVLGNLKPGGVLQVSLAPTAQLGAGMPAFDVRRTNPFRFLQLRAAAPIADPKVATQVIDQLAKNAPKFGAQMQHTTVSNAPAWLTRYAQGEGADLGLVGNTLVVGGPQPSFQAAIARVQKGKAGQGGALSYQDALTGPAVGFVVDLHQLADSVRALPSSAWGIGGFAIKATTLRWLDALHELSALTGGVTGEQNGLSVDLALRFSKR